MNEDSIFAEALGKKKDEREAYLACVGKEDEKLRQRIEALLHAHENPDPFLESPDAAAGTIDDAITERPGAVVGHYKLLEQIGEGGFGVVFMAEQTEPVKRKVALKILKPGMDTKQVIGRFEAERQALALMEHPNIAHVFDAGETASGRPYFVMELVRGVPITEYCDSKKLDTRERLQLFLQVCQAVQHAHQKGIIHRDIKPNNVLVTPHDGVPVVKVIDFGIAKAMSGQLTDKTVFTAFAQMIGTPLYMSPEQAEINALDVDTRSDVYSLGVLLYELLTGATPFDEETLKKAGFDEMRRIIREVEPPRPSARISTMGKLASTASERRKSDPRRLSHALRRELDWIVMKALDKERGRRYETASAFADDVQRYLDDEPILARPATVLLRVQKWVRRHRAVVGTSAIFLALLVILSIVGMAVYASRLQQENALRQAELDERKKKIDALQREKDALEREELGSYYRRILLAQYAWQANDAKRAKQVLDECPIKYRNWEWHYLHRLCHSYPRTLQIDPTAYHNDNLQFVREGTWLVSGGANEKKVTIWDTATGRKVQTFPLPAPLPWSIAVDGTCTRIGVAFGRAVTVWDTATAKKLLHIDTKGLLGGPCAFSDNGKYIAASYSNRGATVWDVTTGAEVFKIPEAIPAANIYHLAFSPDSRYLTVSRKRQLEIWDTTTYKQVHILPHPKKGSEHPIAYFSTDGQYLATAHSLTVRLWRTKDWKLLHTLQGHTGLVYPAFSPDAKKIATASRDKTVKLWDIRTGELVRTYRGHNNWAMASSFNADGTEILSIDTDGFLNVWDATRDQESRKLEFETDAIAALAYSSDGRHFAVGGMALMIRVWDAKTAKELLTFNHGTSITSIALASNGKHLATAGLDTTILWDATKGILIRKFPAKNDLPSSAVAFTPDGALLAAGCADRRVRIWDVQSAKKLFAFKEQKSDICALAFSSDGRFLVSGSAGKRFRMGAKTPRQPPGIPDLKVWDVASGRNFFTLDLPDKTMALAVSPDSTTIAVTFDQGIVKLLDIKTGKEKAAIQAHTGHVRAVTFSPDGSRLVTGGVDGAIKLWDAKTGAEIITIGHHQDMVTNLTFSPDGRQLISSGLIALKVWDTTPLDEAMK